MYFDPVGDNNTWRSISTHTNRRRL